MVNSSEKDTQCLLGKTLRSFFNLGILKTIVHVSVHVCTHVCVCVWHISHFKLNGEFFALLLYRESHYSYDFLENGTR